MKTCTKCHTTKPLKDFRVAKAYRDGHHSHCKRCEYDRLKAWRDRNPGAANRQAAKFRADHRIERRAINHERRAGDRKLTADDHEYMQILMIDPCSYCGAPMEHIDHIDPLHDGGEVDWGNLTAACRSCNQSKGAKPLLVFLGDR